MTSGRHAGYRDRPTARAPMRWILDVPTAVRRVLRRLTAYMSAAVLAVWTQHGAAAAPPFEHLVGEDWTVVSNDGYGLWLYWHAERGTIQYPGRPPFRHDASAPDSQHRVLIEAVCRADPQRSGLSGSSPIRTNLSLPMHPGDPDVPSILNPWLWWLAATGRSETRTAATVSVGGGVAYPTELFERHVDWSFPRPDVRVIIPAAAALQGLLSHAPILVTVRGGSTRIDLSFSPHPNATRAAKAMLRHCAKSPDGA